MKTGVMAFLWTLLAGLMAWNFDGLGSGWGSCCENSGPVRVAGTPPGRAPESWADRKTQCFPAPGHQRPSVGDTSSCLWPPQLSLVLVLQQALQLHSVWLVPRALLLVTDHSRCQQLPSRHVLAAWVSFALLFPWGSTSHSGPAFVSSSQWSHVISWPGRTFSPLPKPGNPWDGWSRKVSE